MHECTSSHSSKWRKEQSFIVNHMSCVRLLTKYESNLPPEHKCMNAQVHTAASGEKRKDSFFIPYLVFECEPNMKVTYQLSTSECTSSQSRKWRKEQSFILNHKCCVRMLTKHESNLPTEHK